MAVHPDTHVKHAHPALFGLLVMPFGIIVGYADVALSYLLGDRGLTTELIGVVVALVGLPHSWKFLWAPALDAGTKRKTWFLASLVTGAVAIALATLIPPDPFLRLGFFTRLEVFTALVAIAEAAAATSSAALDSLMATTLPNEKKGTAAGWYMAGNLGGTGIGGAFIIWITKHAESRLTAALLLMVIILACGLPGLLLRERQPERHPALKMIVALFKDVWRTILSREGWTGLVICLSPVGTGGATKLFGKLATLYIGDEAVREHSVEVVNGMFGGFVAAGGCLVAGYLADRMNRRLLYVLGGLGTAVSAVAMALMPATAESYDVGCLAYNFFNGICYAAFAAFVLEMIGHGPGVTTKYSLYVGASNFAISYVAALDGFGERLGERVFRGETWAKSMGVLGMDALATCVGIGVIGAMIVYVRKRPLADPDEQRAIAGT